MSKKIWAKQVEWDAQDSEDEVICYLEGVDYFLGGNRDMQESGSMKINHIINEIKHNDDLLDRLDNWENIGYSSLREVFHDFSVLETEHVKTLSDAEIQKLAEAIMDYSDSYRYQENKLCRCLSLITGEKWTYTCLRGSVQREWQNFYYVSGEWNNDTLRKFETIYWNEGTEWMIADNPDMDDLYCQYFTENDVDEIRKIIAEQEGVSQEEVCMMEFVEYKQVAQYREV